jgi:hypothetical protein
MAGQGVEDADERVLHQLMDFSYRESLGAKRYDRV